MNPPPIPELPPAANRATTILRVVVWLLPAIIAPACLFGFYSFGAQKTLTSSLWILAPALPVLAVVYALGMFDHRLRCQQQRIPFPNRDAGKVPWALCFLLIQFIVAPTVAVTVLFGFCLIAFS